MGIPFAAVGDCTMRPDPVAVQVASQADDPTTTGNDRSLIVWGLAAHSVDTIEILAGDEHRILKPGRDRAFVASMPPTQGNVEFTLRQSDGKIEKLTLPPAPDLEEINAQMKAGEIPRTKKAAPESALDRAPRDLPRSLVQAVAQRPLVFSGWQCQGTIDAALPATSRESCSARRFEPLTFGSVDADRCSERRRGRRHVSYASAGGS